jgi:hypothetical protein
MEEVLSVPSALSTLAEEFEMLFEEALSELRAA